ncbi:hypothetical protein, partial [Synechococcus sp. MIT S9508]|uniref:hypothetical protein n=1 Tax=Synechococcus sp. MIT S9508 TaxID=1801629 RepID=UPI000B121032
PWKRPLIDNSLKGKAPALSGAFLLFQELVTDLISLKVGDVVTAILKICSVLQGVTLDSVTLINI